MTKAAPYVHMHTHIQATQEPSHPSQTPETPPRFHPKGAICAFYVPQMPLIQYSHSSVHKTTLLRAASQAPGSYMYTSLIPLLLTPWNDSTCWPLIILRPSPKASISLFSLPARPTRSLTHHPAPAYAYPAFTPHFLLGHFSILFLLSWPTATPGSAWPWTLSFASKKGPYSYQGPQCHGPRQHCPH